jgi:hypothetical protein
LTTLTKNWSIWRTDRDEALEVDRFGHIGVGVQRIAAQDVLVRLRRGEHHHRNLPQVLVCLDLGQHLPAVAPGQVQVEQHQVGPHRVGVLALAAQVGQRLVPVGDHGQPVADLVLGEGLLRHEYVARIVLDEEHLDRGARRPSEVVMPPAPSLGETPHRGGPGRSGCGRSGAVAGPSAALEIPGLPSAESPARSPAA